MIRPSPWPELDRLARFVRASDSLTDTLATWTGRGLAVEVMNRVDGVCPDPLVADSLALYDGARVQDRVVLMRCGDVVVAAARSWVAADSPALTPAVRLGYDERRPEQLRERPQSGGTGAGFGGTCRICCWSTPMVW